MMNFSEIDRFQRVETYSNTSNISNTSNSTPSSNNQTLTSSNTSYSLVPRSPTTLGSILDGLEPPVINNIWSTKYNNNYRLDSPNITNFTIMDPSRSKSYDNGSYDGYGLHEINLGSSPLVITDNPSSNKNASSYGYNDMNSRNNLITPNPNAYVNLSNSSGFTTSTPGFPSPANFTTNYSHFDYGPSENSYTTSTTPNLYTPPTIRQQYYPRSNPLTPNSGMELTKTEPQVKVIQTKPSEVKPKKFDTPKLDEQTHYFKNYLGNYFNVSSHSKFFVIKSYNLVDVNASFINNIWASTELGNKRLSKAFKTGHDIYLLFSVNGSGKFCGIAKMTSDIDFNKQSDIWSEVSRWKGVFEVEWLLVKDIPNKYFQQFKIISNENKSVTNSRDTQEIPFSIAMGMFKIFGSFKHSTSFLM